MNEGMQERLRSRAWLTWLLGDTSFRAGEPMTFPRKRIGGGRDTLRNARPVEQAPVDLRAGNPKFRQFGKFLPFDQIPDEGFPIGAGRRLGFRLALSGAIAVAALRP